MNYGDMKSKSWSLASKGHVNYDDDDEDNNSNNRIIEEPEEEEEEEQQPIKPGTTFKAARDAMVERKIQAADARGQMFK
jgi:hypothetical protein